MTAPVISFILSIIKNKSSENMKKKGTFVQYLEDFFIHWVFFPDKISAKSLKLITGSLPCILWCVRACVRACVLGDVGLSVTDPHGADVPVTTEALKNNAFRIGFEPKQPGIYEANVYFGDQQVPGSPFQVGTSWF